MSSKVSKPRPVVKKPVVHRTAKKAVAHKPSVPIQGVEFDDYGDYIRSLEAKE